MSKDPPPNPSIDHNQELIRSAVHEYFAYWSQKSVDSPISYQDEADLFANEMLRYFDPSAPPYKGRSFNYIQQNSDPAMIRAAASDNMRYWFDIFGADFFRSRKKHREVLLTSPPVGDTGLFLTTKGGSGAGTFSIDIAISIQRNMFRPTGELWRIGIDTYRNPETGVRTARIIRAGSGLKSSVPDYQEKFDANFEFNKFYGVKPIRALGLLALHTMHDLPGVDEIAIVRRNSMSSNDYRGRKRSSRSPVKFSYDTFAASFGLSIDPNNRMWATLSNSPENFYSALLDNASSRELELLELLAQAFTQLKNNSQLRTTEFSNPLQILNQYNPVELEGYINAYRTLRR